MTTPDSNPGPPASLPESWEAMVRFMARIGRYPGHAGWARVGAALLAEGQRRGLDQHFRAGQSMQHLIFSTSPHHGLRDELRVTVAWPEQDRSSAKTGARIEVSLGRTNRWFSVPDRLSVADADDGWMLVAEYLRALWHETRNAPLPDGLRPSVRDPGESAVDPEVDPASED